MAHFSGLPVHSYDHGRGGKRAGLLSMPRLYGNGEPEQPARPADAGPGGHGARMLQRDDVPQPGGPPGGVGRRFSRSTASRNHRESGQRVPRLPGLPRCQLRRQRGSGVVLEQRRLSRRRGLFTASSETLGQRCELHPYEYLHLREPGEPLGMRELPPQRREPYDVSAAEPACPAWHPARLLQQHPVSQLGGCGHASGSVQ